MGLGIFSPGAWEARSVLKAVEQLHEQQTPVRVEIERLGVRFKTFVTLRKDVIAVARPMGFKGELPAGTVMRLRVPGKNRRELRLQIHDADYRLPNGRAFFLCALPEAFAKQSPRSAERYTTGRFTNLELVFPGLGTGYHILDLSRTGCRFDPGREQLSTIWTAGEFVPAAFIQIGTGIRIQLEGVVPRSMKPDAIGVEFRFSTDGKSVKHMETLVTWLDKREEKQSRVVKE